MMDFFTTCLLTVFFIVLVLFVRRLGAELLPVFLGLLFILLALDLFASVMSICVTALAVLNTEGFPPDCTGMDSA